MNFLFHLLSVGIGTESNLQFTFSEQPSWRYILGQSNRHGVLALVFDGYTKLVDNGLIPAEYLPSQSNRMKWVSNVMKIEDVCRRQYQLSSQIASVYQQHGIKTVVLKGIASGTLYPNPYHRPCGDLDCFLMGEYDRGNTIAAEIGAQLKGHDTKHSHIRYKGLEIENHKFCTPVAGSKNAKVFERHLQELLGDNGATPINDTSLLNPDPTFNAVFLTVHSWRHFVYEALRLHQVCDWALLMHHHADDIDWNRYVTLLNLRDTRILDFARHISLIAHEQLSAPLPSIFRSEHSDALTQKVLHSILNDKDPSKLPTNSFFRRKYLILRTMLRPTWKLRQFTHDTPIKNTLKNLYVYFFERNPKI